MEAPKRVNHLANSRVIRRNGHVFLCPKLNKPNSLRDELNRKPPTKSTCTITGPFRLSDLPAEIRILIFRKCVSRRENGKAPALIEALRRNPQLYHEALEVYYSINDFSVSFNTRYRLDLNGNPVLKRILSLRLWYEYGNTSVPS